MVPILLLGFNRPHLSSQVLDTIRSYRPKHLYFAVDGPREGNLRDIELVSQTEDLASTIDWDCTVQKLFRKKNLGCQRAVTESINWFFDNVEEGIILEDDCLPSQSFFQFCEQLLEQYRADTRVMSIAGESYDGEWKNHQDSSYSFSRYALIWGWATWKRAWKFYDGQMITWPDVADSEWLSRFHESLSVRQYWQRNLWKTFRTPGYTWDYQWILSCWLNSGLCAVPTENLVSNLGCGNDATHTFNPDWQLANRPSNELGFPMIHPNFVSNNFLLDNCIETTRFEIQRIDNETIPKGEEDNRVPESRIRQLVRRIGRSLKS